MLRVACWGRVCKGSESVLRHSGPHGAMPGVVSVSPHTPKRTDRVRLACALSLCEGRKFSESGDERSGQQRRRFGYAGASAGPRYYEALGFELLVSPGCCAYRNAKVRRNLSHCRQPFVAADLTRQDHAAKLLEDVSRVRHAAALCVVTARSRVTRIPSNLTRSTTTDTASRPTPNPRMPGAIAEYPADHMKVPTPGMPIPPLPRPAPAIRLSAPPRGRSSEGMKTHRTAFARSRRSSASLAALSGRKNGLAASTRRNA